MRRTGLLLLLLGVLVVGLAEGQRRRGGGEEAMGDQGFLPNVPYDGRFTFVRVKYNQLADFGFRGGGPTWAHDYARAERHFTKILEELTTIQPRVMESNILALDDPELFKYPVAYLCEPGFWNPSDKEVEGLRAYLQKGGFFIIDDFQGNQIFNLETQLRRVMPEARMIPIPLEHPIFDAFYRIETFDVYTHPYSGMQTQFLGVFEQNDPTKRPMIVINYNGDIAEYWEFSDTGFLPIDLSNEAYKLGVNYIVYALTR
jgi:hypothetical protein